MKVEFSVRTPPVQIAINRPAAPERAGGRIYAFVPFVSCPCFRNLFDLFLNLDL